MIGIIVTGHGNFASGLTSSLELIAGAQEKYEIVDFPQGDGVEELTQKLNAAMDSLQDTDGILVLSDLAGGSPFKTAVMCSLERKNVEVIAGTNLPLLIEASLSKAFQENVTDFADTLIGTGQSQILRFAVEEPAEQEEFSDGI